MRNKITVALLILNSCISLNKKKNVAQCGDTVNVIFSSGFKKDKIEVSINGVFLDSFILTSNKLLEYTNLEINIKKVKNKYYLVENSQTLKSITTEGIDCVINVKHNCNNYPIEVNFCNGGYLLIRLDNTKIDYYQLIKKPVFN